MTPPAATAAGRARGIARGFALPKLRLPALRLSRRSVRAMAIAAIVLVVGYFGWFRHSSLVAVRHVTVTGASTPDAPQIVEALTTAAERQSTLDVHTDALRAAVAGFPTVASLSVDPNFPSSVAIHVVARPPAMLASDGDTEVPVAADGTILSGLELSDDAAAKLPVLTVKRSHTDGRLGGHPLARALVLGAAPEGLRPLIQSAATDPQTGITVTLRGGFRIEFGSSDAADAKWAAAAAVLADRKLHTLAYVDVSVPDRPAVGGP